MSVVCAVAPGAGTGLLARRPDAVLFASSTDERDVWSELLPRFIGAATADDAWLEVTRAVLSCEFAIDPFVLVSWSSMVQVLAFGDADISTDLPSLPMLSGRGSTSWVEHRSPTRPERCSLWAGESPREHTDLVAGIVPAAGFRVEVIGDSVVSDQRPPTFVAQPTPVPSTPILDTPTSSTPERRPAWATLQAAGGDDWMEDSLGMGPVEIASTPTPTLTSIATPAGTSDPPATPELADDPEITLDPERITATEDPSPPPLRTLQARRCPANHLNPLTAALCRTCREPVDPKAAVEIVPQPRLGSLSTPDGETLVIDRTIVLGRSPDPAAARVDEPALLHRIAAGNDVSRTHAVVRADGWMMEVVDCGSSGHTVLVAAGNEEPIMLEPWVPHELNHGDVLYLGGPTRLQVIE